MTYRDHFAQLVLNMARNAMQSAARDINKALKKSEKKYKYSSAGFDQRIGGGEMNAYRHCLEILQSHFAEINTDNSLTIENQRKIEHAD